MLTKTTKKQTNRIKKTQCVVRQKGTENNQVVPMAKAGTI